MTRICRVCEEEKEIVEFPLGGANRTPTNRCRACTAEYKKEYQKKRKLDMASKFCSVEGCSNSLKAKGMCNVHYKRMKIHGSLENPERITPPDPAYKNCSICKELKSTATEYYAKVDRPGYTHARCKKCYRKDATRNMLRRNYNLTLDEYSEMLENQNGVCKICLQPENKISNGKVIALAVDHDHQTGENRGLLCNRCNRMIGFAEDKTEILENAISYLEDYR